MDTKENQKQNPVFFEGPTRTGCPADFRRKMMKSPPRQEIRMAGFPRAIQKLFNANKKYHCPKDTSALVSPVKLGP